MGGSDRFAKNRVARFLIGLEMEPVEFQSVFTIWVVATEMNIYV